MRSPSNNLKRQMSKMVGERDFFAGTRKDEKLGEVVRDGMASEFGALLYTTLEELERANYAAIVNVCPTDISKHQQIRAELNTVQYIKSRLETYVVNADALMSMMEELQNGEA